MTSLIHAGEARFFGDHNGRFLPPQFETPIAKMAAAYVQARQDPGLQAKYEALLVDYVGCPSPLFLAAGLTRHLGGTKIYLKRKDLNHTGAHEINHCLGEGLLTKRMGKKKLIAEAGTGQHGVVLATAAAPFGLEREIHMGAVDVAKQHPDVVQMEMLGAKVTSIASGGQALKEAINSAFSVFAADYADTSFATGSAIGPDPYPPMTRDFQSIIGREARRQVLEKEDHLPDALVATIGGGSNALGLSITFLEDGPVKMFDIEPTGRNLEMPDQHAATITLGTPGTLYGMRTLLLQDEDGNPARVYSIASGLDYPGAGPQHTPLRDTGHVGYVTAPDDETIAAFQLLCYTEGITPALESPRTLAHITRLAPTTSSDKVIVVNLSGHGDGDVDYVVEYLTR